MTATSMVRYGVRHLVLPFLYFASMMPVVIGLITVLTFIEYSIGWRDYAPGIGLGDLTTLYFNGDVAGMVALVLIGGPVFGFLSWCLTRSDGVQRPPLIDHLRHCAFLYGFTLILGALLAVEFARNLITGNPIYEVPKVVALWGVAGFAIVVDALVLVRQRRRLGWSNQEGTA